MLDQFGGKPDQHLPDALAEAEQRLLENQRAELRELRANMQADMQTELAKLRTQMSIEARAWVKAELRKTLG
jgi:hypothetical protein